MPGPYTPSLHPLLLERSYWRHRLEAMTTEQPSLIIVPRPDLSTTLKEVVEFRLRAHDGIRLWGMMARSALSDGSQPACIRLIGPSDVPELDSAKLEEGWAEFIFQAPPGRRLEDRVLDTMRVCQVAQGTDGIDPERVVLETPKRKTKPNEFLIASRLLADGFAC